MQCNQTGPVVVDGSRFIVGAGFKPALAPHTRTIRSRRGNCEHLIRNEKTLDRIRAYIANNRVRRADEPENISRAVPAEVGRV